MSELVHRVEQLEQERVGHNEDHNVLMKIATKVEMLDPTAIIEFKAVAVNTLKKISADLDEQEKAHDEIKNLVVLDKAEVLVAINTNGTRITVLEVKAAMWGALSGAITSGLIALIISLVS